MFKSTLELFFCNMLHDSQYIQQYKFYILTSTLMRQNPYITLRQISMIKATAVVECFSPERTVNNGYYISMFQTFRLLQHFSIDFSWINGAQICQNNLREATKKQLKNKAIQSSRIAFNLHVDLHFICSGKFTRDSN